MKVDLTVMNEEGLHARPASQLVQALQGMECQVFLAKVDDGEEVDAKSILGVMMLAAERGTKMSVRAKGKDSQKAIEAVSRILSEKGGS
ncbi:MAG: HPr family phosphocarrier protein [Candidatus Omnitrophica bacterium]|nr:HPr family phosphocarrier protein [Candidatus Omnitrophota bacterium]MCA9434271.1 HPr family phosphocarrier protein [Candidatus Omnitrophota bacterium]MCA9446366.1 HPr family phosphocarrier protein [Candidatus Omnitrophota bacterium]